MVGVVGSNLIARSRGQRVFQAIAAALRSLPFEFLEQASIALCRNRASKRSEEVCQREVMEIENAKTIP
jgi:hypothetical protein